MQIVRVVLQSVVALSLMNVWLLRFSQGTPYRGGNAENMREEFAAYGLPVWCIYLVGTLKVGASLCLLAGIWAPRLVFPAALVVSILMVGALGMHLKIGDPVKKSVPAMAILAMSAIICWGSYR